jgi:hypothetical protein
MGQVLGDSHGSLGNRISHTRNDIIPGNLSLEFGLGWNLSTSTTRRRAKPEGHPVDVEDDTGDESSVSLAIGGVESAGLYAVVRDNLATLYGAVEDGAVAISLPAFVSKELDGYLECGML